MRKLLLREHTPPHFLVTDSQPHLNNLPGLPRFQHVKRVPSANPAKIGED